MQKMLGNAVISTLCALRGELLRALAFKIFFMLRQRADPLWIGRVINGRLKVTDLVCEQMLKL